MSLEKKTFKCIALLRDAARLTLTFSTLNVESQNKEQ